eukprot:17290-Heterococcus_DN1.PRE.4
MARKAVAQLPSVPPLEAQHTAAKSLQAMMPVVYVLLAFSLVLGIASMFFKGKSKQSLLNIYLLGAAALSIHALAQTDELEQVLQHIWRIFISLSDAAKVYYTVTCLALLHLLLKIYGSVVGARDTAVMTAPRLVNRDDTAESLGAEYPDNLDWKGDAKGSFAVLCDILIAETLIDLKEEYEGIPEQIDWIARMLEYNVKGGKMNRGIGVIDVQRAFAAQAGRDLSDIEYCRASVLGWCIEWLQSCFLVADDVMDESVTRRGNPCWYRLPDVKQIAINDSMIIDSLVYKVLKRHFEHEAYYNQMVELFHDVSYRTKLGQLLDLTSQALDKPPDFSRFTACMIASTPSGVLPAIAVALLNTCQCVVSITHADALLCHNPSSFAMARKICCIIGEYFQVQDDFLDCYADPEVLGKIGTDIQDMKCSWLIVQALDCASQEQRKQITGQISPVPAYAYTEVLNTA